MGEDRRSLCHDEACRAAAASEAHAGMGEADARRAPRGARELQEAEGHAAENAQGAETTLAGVRTVAHSARSSRACSCDLTHARGGPAGLSLEVQHVPRAAQDPPPDTS